LILQAAERSHKTIDRIVSADYLGVDYTSVRSANAKKGRMAAIMIERLENRRLLSATVSFDEATGILTINGSDGDDKISLSAAAGTESVSAEGVQVFNSLDYEPDVKLVDIHAGGGNDTLDIFAYRDGSQVHVDAGAGNDLLSVKSWVVYRTIVHGGEGDDTITYSGHIEVGDKVFGDGGNDRIDAVVGPGGPETLSRNTATLFDGGDGNDIIHEQNYTWNANTVLGGNGDDSIVTSSSRTRELVNGGTSLSSISTDNDSITILRGGALPALPIQPAASPSALQLRADDYILPTDQTE